MEYRVWAESSLCPTQSLPKKKRVSGLRVVILQIGLRTLKSPRILYGMSKNWKRDEISIELVQWKGGINGGGCSSEICIFTATCWRVEETVSG